MICFDNDDEFGLMYFIAAIRVKNMIAEKKNRNFLGEFRSRLDCLDLRLHEAR